MNQSMTGGEFLDPDEYETLIARISDVITIVDTDGVIRYQSPSSEAVKGWKPEALVGEKILEYVHPDDRDRVAMEFGKLRGEVGRIDEEIEFRFRTRDDEWIWLAATGSAPRPDQEIEGYITISRDITPRKEAEQALETERDRLAMLNQIVRHDIRNDMAVILGWAEELDDRIDDDEEAAILSHITTAAEHTRDITTAVRDLAALLEADEPSLEPIDLAEVLRQQVQQLESRYSDHVETLTVTGIDELPESLTVEATPLLSSVFSNLLNNAVFHSDTDAVEIDIGIALTDDTVRVSVADNGPGVPDAQKGTVFGRGEKSLDSPGTGLGLYLVDNLVATYGGDVWVEDNEPEGAVFVVELCRA